MATRSTISIQQNDGSILSVYSHWDGYPSWNGKLLLEHYNTKEKVLKLVSLGSISSLSESIEKPEGHSFDNPVEKYTVFYGRDRGEADTGPRKFSSFEEVMEKYSEEYNYLFKDGKWYVTGGSFDNTELTADIVNKD